MTISTFEKASDDERVVKEIFVGQAMESGYVEQEAIVFDLDSVETEYRVCSFFWEA